MPSKKEPKVQRREGEGWKLVDDTLVITELDYRNGKNAPNRAFPLEDTRQQQACDRLANVVRKLAHEYWDELEKSKDHARYLEPDFVWRALVRSSATWGSSRGYEGLFGRPHNYSKITFTALSALSPKARFDLLLETLTASKVRMAKKKAAFLAANFVIIEAMGGLSEAKRQLNDQRSQEAMMAFMRQFKGIGQKYARDIFMDVYHPEFRQSIAVDARIQSISKELGLSLRPYPEGERFYLAVAQQAGLNGWELDRLLYRFTKEALAALQEDGGSKAGKLRLSTE
jgi:hypothetical protein